MKLSEKNCTPCEGNTPPLSKEESIEFIQEIEQWNLIEDKAIEKTFLFKDFKGALDFINKVGTVAEKEGHHPDLNLFGWNKVKIRLSTHAINGLSDNDFILAAKIDEINR